ncbi:MAG: hypothetical protein SGCHY_002997 [Lobulomycetales sp.]
MRCVIQRVQRACVTVGGQTVSSIDKGLCVLVGISASDTPDDRAWTIKKLTSLRLWPQIVGEDGSSKEWSASVSDLGLPILIVSQFTLLARTNKGRKPDFSRAMSSRDGLAESFFEEFANELREAHGSDRVLLGKFGAMMQ